jgi:peroxiredoxin
VNESSANPPPLPPEQSSSKAAIVSLVLGILALVFALIVVGGLLGVVGLIAGTLHLRRQVQYRAMAWWGIGFSSAAILASIGLGFAYYAGYQKAREFIGNTQSSSSAKFTSWEGQPAPDISVTTQDGETIQLSQFKGKRVVLDFWATWCPPCVREIPHFVQLTRETSRDDLVIIGITNEGTNVLQQFAQKHQINYPIGSPAELVPPYSEVAAIPTTFFIDTNGVIESVITGYHDLDALRSKALDH